VFEVGLTVQLDSKEETGTRNERRVAAAVSHSTTNYSEIKAYTEAFLGQLGKDYSFQESKDTAFIEGRAVVILIKGKPVGVMGEISPQVLENFKIEYPVTLFELGVEELV